MRIGIITHYYGNTNYGGILQSYALCRYINQYTDFTAEQISYSPKHTALDKRYNLLSFLASVLNGVRSRIIKTLFQRKSNEIQMKLKTAFSDFSASIPHNEVVYTSETVSDCNDRYDAFITGSDQVWNPEWYNPAYFLDFAGSEKPKFSYAASVGKTMLTDKQKKVFYRHLSGYIGVSVREEDAVALLKDICRAEWVLDPVLLLNREEWDDICADRLISEKYVFCFFLENGGKMRRTASRFAKQRNLKVATLPYLLGKYRICDARFGDIKMQGVTPEQFISLIKYAEFIFTDSYHACVFSSIYKKEYFAFTRNGKKEMGSRIYSLVKIFENEDHFCDSAKKMTVKYINSLEKTDYNKKLSSLEEMREKSISYLERNLRKSNAIIYTKSINRRDFSTGIYLSPKSCIKQ